MHTVELLDQCCEIARRLGYGIRHEWLGGSSGGACEFAGRKWIFIDLALNAEEQLEQIAVALRADPAVHLLELSAEVSQQLGLRNAA
jgi:hypothetical protein